MIHVEHGRLNLIAEAKLLAPSELSIPLRSSFLEHRPGLTTRIDGGKGCSQELWLHAGREGRINRWEIRSRSGPQSST
jgi:hypothetical protein